MMMAFGQFVFSLTTAAFQELQRQTTWRHPWHSRVGARPARQFVGPGDDTIDLNGLVALEITGGRVGLDQLREMGDSGAAEPLADGAGRIYGEFVLESMNETHSVFLADGTAQRIEFQLKLTRVDDRRAQAATVRANGLDD